jgi:DNA polymerase-1
MDEVSGWFETHHTGTWSLALGRVDDNLTRSPLVAVAITTEAAEGILISVSTPALDELGVDAQTLLPLLVSQLGASEIELQVHGAKRFWLTLAGHATDAVQIRFDTELASYLLDPEEPHDLASLALRHGGDKSARPPAPFQRAARTPISRDMIEQRTMRQSELVHRLSPQLAPRIEDEGLTELLRNVELPLTRTLATMQRLGVLVDISQLSAMSIAMDLEMAELEKRAVDAATHPFNLNSPRQLETILFDELKLKPLRRTKTSRSTDAATLEALAEEHPLPNLILQHRQVAKLKSTYVDALPHLVAQETGRVHSSWEQTVTATGRLSSTEPNLQNIPVRTELGRAIRRAFVAPPGTKLLSADYSQIELRILAHLSQDPELLEAFVTGQDVHLRTAMAVFGVSEGQITHDMRRQAKAVNFGVIYGQGESGLAAALGIPRQQASEFIAAYYRRYRGVREFMNKTIEHARHGKAVESMLGRRRYFNDIDSANRGLRLSAERMAMNMPIQATAADILKLAMLKLTAPVTPGARMVMTVHDELVFEIPGAEVDVAQERIRAIMQGVVALDVPLLVDIGVADNWADAH